MKRKIVYAVLALALLSSCGTTDEPAQNPADPPPAASETVQITLQGSSVQIEGAGAAATDSGVVITAAGIYQLSGSLDNGQIEINAPGADVALILDGASLSCSRASPLYVRSAGSVSVRLAEGTENTLTGTAENLDAALYSTADLTLQGEGALEITAEDGVGVSCEGGLTITGGSYTVTSSANAFHSDGTLSVSGGRIDILSCDEGLEGFDVEILDGDIRISSSDDGINAAGDGDGTHTISIFGGTITVIAGGDGLDSNGDIVMTGGTVLSFSTGMADGALDCDGDFSLTGGLLLAAGGGMAMSPGAPEQYTIFAGFDAAQEAGTYVQISGPDAEFVFCLPVSASNFVFSAPELTQGAVYTLSSGGVYSGGEGEILCSGGTYSGGAAFAELELTQPLTTYGSAALGGFGGGPGGPGGPDFQPGSQPEGMTPPQPPEGEAPEFTPPDGEAFQPPEPPDGNGTFAPPTPPQGGGEPPEPPESPAE